MEFSDPIRTVTDAERYFRNTGCSHFHMHREYPARYEEYQRLGVTRQMEDAWRLDEFEKRLARLRDESLASEELWELHSDAADLACHMGHRVGGSDPQVAIDAAGNALVVWLQYEGSRLDLWSQELVK